MNSHQGIADHINQTVASGGVVTFKGRTVVAPFGSTPATVWQNGSLSVQVRAKGGRPGSFNLVWVKVGQPMPAIEVGV
jgi:hypothetical protein